MHYAVDDLRQAMRIEISENKLATLYIRDLEDSKKYIYRITTLFDDENMQCISC
jgi:hypothetical protein